MPSSTSQQTIMTTDGTGIVVTSWLKDAAVVAMKPGASIFTATCPEHGDIETSYVSMMVGFAIQDHARESHGGLLSAKDLLDIGPSIQL